MYKKIILYTFALMFQYVCLAMNIYNDMSPQNQAKFRSFVATQQQNGATASLLFTMNNTASSSNNYDQTSSVFGSSDTMGFHNSPYNRVVNSNEAYRNPLLHTGLSSLSLAELVKRDGFRNSLRNLQLAGNFAALKALHMKIMQEKNSYCWIRFIKHYNRACQLKQIESVMSDPMTKRLHTINHGSLQAAMKAFNEFPWANFSPSSPLGSGVNKITTTVPEGQTSQIFDRSELPAEFQAGLQMLNARPDYQAYMKAQQEKMARPAESTVAAIAVSPTETSQEQTTASITHNPSNTTASIASTVAESLLPLDDTIAVVKSVAADSSEVRQKLVAIKNALQNKSSSSSSSVDTYIEKQIQFVDMVLDGTLADTVYQLQYADFDTAAGMYQQLAELWPWYHERPFMVRNTYGPEAVFVQALGIDIMAVIEGHVIARSENIMRAGLGHEIDGYLNGCVLWQMQGDVMNLKAEQARLKGELSIGSKELFPAIQFIIIERILRDPMTNSLCTIVHGDLKMAKTAFHSLQMDLLKYFEPGCDFSTMAQARAAMEREKGFDVQKAAHSCYQARPDCPQTFSQSYAYNEQLMQMLFNIRHADFNMATKEFAALNEQLAGNLSNAGIQDTATKDFILEHIGFDVLEVATALYHARPEYQAQLVEPIPDGYHPIPVSAIPKEIRSVRAGMVEALNQSKHQAQLADNVEALACDMFGLARHHNYEIHPEAYDQVYISIGVIRVTHHAHEIVFHVAIVDRVLGDIQMQAMGQQMPDQPSLLERSPELLVHGLKKFIQGFNPVTQIMNGVEFWVGTAHFVVDITVGGLYLTPEQYQARIDGFWQSVEAFYPSNLAQLNAEQWVEMGAQMAADFVYAKGVAGTLAYLKEIDAMSRAQRRVAVIADKFKKGFDKVLGKEPIIVTPEGIIWKASSECEELMSFQKSSSKASGGAREVIKDSKELLNKEKELLKHKVQLPDYIQGNRVPMDRETILKSGQFQRTNFEVKHARVYKKDGKFYHRDTLHTGKGAHLEVYNKQGHHIGIADPLTGELIPNTAVKGRTLHD